MNATMLSPPATWTPYPRLDTSVDMQWLADLQHDHGPPGWRDPVGEFVVRRLDRKRKP